ncbi:MAG: hypothetical protein JO257_30005 [Deltaproteobacteria bacterium]|nr:hypothetical protein [Deltaproteobacteria bacterium]
MHRAAALLLLLAAACERSDGVHATRFECLALSAELQAYADRANEQHGNSGWYKYRVFGTDTDRCMQRMTSKQVLCGIAKLRADEFDTSACR